MFEIRQEQYERLEGAARGGFHDRILGHLIRVYPEFVAARDDATLRGWIEEAAGRAASYGLDFEPEVVAFVEMTVEHGRQFELLPENRRAREILTDGELTDVEKIDALRHAFEDDIEIEDESDDEPDTQPGRRPGGLPGPMTPPSARRAEG